MSTALVRGQGKFVADINDDDNLLHLAVLRSPYAHARVKSIDFSRIMDKTVHVFGPDQLNALCTELPVIWTAEGMKIATQPVLAKRKVRYVGQPVACVAAKSFDAAKDALDLIGVEYDPLEAVIDPEASMRVDAPILHDELYKDNVGLQVKNVQGNVEEAFQKADITFKEKFRISRIAPAPMEPRGVLASYDPIKGELTVYSSTQIPYMLKHVLAKTLKMQENRIRVIVPNVGGGFGGKDSIYPEEALASIVSIILGKPVKWIEDRTENLTVSNHDRDQVQFVEVAAKSDGTLTALRVRILVNAGAYYRFHGAREVFIVLFMLSGQYRIPNLEAEGISVFTNTMSTFPYRGPGSTEASFLIERVMDIIAKKTGIDPAIVRQRNLIRELPYKTATGAVYDSGDYAECLKIALEVSEYEKFRAAKKEKEDFKLLGIGIGCYLEQAGLGPSRIIGRLGIRQGGWERSSVIVDQSGRVSVISGIQSIGQGTEQAIAQIVAKELGVPTSTVNVLYGDTALSSFGGGAFASRSTSVGGTASLLAAREVKKKILKLASHMLEARIDDLIFENGEVRVKGMAAGPTLSLSEIADNAYVMENVPEDMEPGLEASAAFDPPNFTFSNGVVVAKVEVDLETGFITPLSLCLVHDCGTVINVELVEGQIQGAVAQGLGEALLEEVIYDESGQPLSSTFTDYLLPSAMTMPELTISHMESPTPVNLLGAKGVGESGSIGTPVAIANAVVDALSSFDCDITQLPLKPEQLLNMMKAKRGLSTISQ